MSKDRIPVPVKPLVAGAIKTAVHHIRLIEQELLNVGAALNADQITPQRAIDMVEEIAPGTIGYLSPLTGLSLPRKPDVDGIAKREEISA
jgi:hypothetical protein